MCFFVVIFRQEYVKDMLPEENMPYLLQAYSLWGVQTVFVLKSLVTL